MAKKELKKQLTRVERFLIKAIIIIASKIKPLTPDVANLINEAEQFDIKESE